jgi:anti-anti-sigma regulatory factor
MTDWIRFSYSILPTTELPTDPFESSCLKLFGVVIPQKTNGVFAWQRSCSYHGQIIFTEEIMSNIHVDKVGDMAVVECEGRFVRSDEAFRLRDAVASQRDAHVIVLDLTEMRAIGGGAIGVLVFLQRWARDRDIRFKLFNPSRFIKDKLEHTNALSEFDIASLDEMMALLGHADSRYALAS